MRSERVAVVIEPVVVQEAATAGPRSDTMLLIALLFLLPMCVALTVLVRPTLSPVSPVPNSVASNVRELGHSWSTSTPPTLNVIGSGYAPFESVSLFAAPSLEASYASFIPISTTLAAADGTILATGIDLGPNLAAVNGLQLYGRGLTSGILINGGLLSVPATPTPTPTPTPTAIPAPPPPAAPPAPEVPPEPIAAAPVIVGDVRPPWNETYFANRDQIPPIVLTRNSAVLNYRWGRGAPDSFMQADNFSAVFTRTIYVPQLASLVFKLYVEGAAKVYVDNELIIDQWFLGPARDRSGTYCSLPGERVIRVEYYTGKGSAGIGLKWYNGFRGWAARYFNNSDLQPPLVYLCDSEQINYAWGDASPYPQAGVNPDNFSVQWERTVTFEATGVYEFTLQADDGARLIFDGKIIPELDTWAGGGPTTRTTQFVVPAGKHFMQVQYRELTGAAMIKFDMRLVQVAPVSAITPGPFVPTPKP